MSVNVYFGYKFDNNDEYKCNTNVKQHTIQYNTIQNDYFPLT